MARPSRHKGSKDTPRDLKGGFANRPLAGLAGLRASLPGAERAPEAAPTEVDGKTDTPEDAAPTGSTGKGPSGKGSARKGVTDGDHVVVRRERKGRAGKTVTRISGLGSDPKRLATQARELKRALGCGASVEGVDVLLQGALEERAVAWLRDHGHARVTRGT